jgi:hypothetical protein
MSDRLTALLRGAPEDLRSWIDQPGRDRLFLCISVIAIAFGLYGFTVGFWRDPLMGLFVAIKMPALIFLTLAGNGLLNGMLGLLLGSRLGFRQSLMAQLMSFTIAALVLGALAPVTFFMALNAPTSDAANASTAHSHFLVAHTILIALAGIIANLHLARLLIAVTPPGSRTAAPTLFAWLAGNAFLGAQLSWIMRPFFGTPTMEVAFLREKPFNGTFYETVWFSLQRITGGNGFAILMALAVAILILLLPVVRRLKASAR